MTSTSGWLSANDCRTPIELAFSCRIVCRVVLLQLEALMSSSGKPLGQEGSIGAPNAEYGLYVGQS